MARKRSKWAEDYEEAEKFQKISRKRRRPLEEFGDPTEDRKKDKNKKAKDKWLGQ